jgi:RimJ/RimL family protein N-acetyltransferase
MSEALFNIPTLTTDRLTLRAPQLSDFDTYAEFCASGRSKGVGGPYDRDQAFDRLCEVAGHWLLRGYGRWLVADIATNQPLGIVGLMYPCDWPEPEIAWTVFEGGEGKGIAYEAALASRRYAYNVLGWKTVISCTMTDNLRSIALAKRMGAIQEPSYQHPNLGELYVWRHPSNEAVQ